jgi:hypothetical protein
MSASSWADIVRGTTNHAVQEKVTEKQQGSGGGGDGQPPGDGGGWQPDRTTQKKSKDKALADHRKELQEQAEARLTACGFALGDYTYVCPLRATVTVGQQKIATHVTVNIGDLSGATKAAHRTDTLADVFARLPYHVTLEEYDDRSDPNNPRRYSDGRWETQGSKYGAAVKAPAKAAVDEAHKVMLALRT